MAPKPDPAGYVAAMWLSLLIACRSGAHPGVQAIVDPGRAEHFLDLPFPSDALLDERGRPDLQGFPAPDQELAASLVDGWARRLEQTAVGVGNNPAAYFRFEGPLDGVPEGRSQTAGSPDDPVLWVGLDDPELLPLELRFVGDPLGDPFYGEHTLAAAPALGAPPRSGQRYAAVVMASAGAVSPPGYAVDDEVRAALAAAGVSGEPAVATSFTVQDATGQLRALFDDADGRLPDWSGVRFRRVVHLRYSQGQTPSGQDATVATATFEDGEESVAWLAPLGESGEHEVDLLDWPMAVYQAEIETLNYQGLDDRPYMSAGLGHLTDFDRMSGWIDMTDGAPPTPEPEPMRVVVSLPLGADGRPLEGAPVILYDHGTGGHAYHSVQRRNRSDDGRPIAQALADEGVAIIGRDAALYGTRYPLIDEGYGASLGFYNIVNLPAFRDNQRQTAIDGHLLLRFVEDGLNQALPEGSVDPGRVARAGHSLGSVTANLGAAGEPWAYQGVLLSGSGGVFSEYFLDTGLLENFDSATLESLFALLGQDVPETITAPAALGAALGLEEEAWAHLDRLHPVMGLFQWTMDPSDPMAVARDEQTPALLLAGVGDYQVPNPTSEALAGALPDAELRWCAAQSDYDPHYCLFREAEGEAIFRDWLGGLFGR